VVPLEHDIGSRGDPWSSFRGKGIATSALRSFLGVDVERPLFAWVARHNAGSIRVLEKVGFVPAGEDGVHLIYRLG
jgi:RimJ/RimL family protein N-acetyltransferase